MTYRKDYFKNNYSQGYRHILQATYYKNKSYDKDIESSSYAPICI